MGRLRLCCMAGDVSSVAPGVWSRLWPPDAAKQLGWIAGVPVEGFAGS